MDRIPRVIDLPPTFRAPRNIARTVGVILLIIAIFWLSPFGTIGAGERGVHLRFTAPTGRVIGIGLDGDRHHFGMVIGMSLES